MLGSGHSLFHIWSPGRRADLSIFLPANVLGRPGHSSFDVVRKIEEVCGLGERVLDLKDGYPMVGYTEEAIMLCSLDKLLGYLANTSLKIVKRYSGDSSISVSGRIRTHNAAFRIDGSSSVAIVDFADKDSIELLRSDAGRDLIAAYWWSFAFGVCAAPCLKVTSS